MEFYGKLLAICKCHYKKALSTQEALVLAIREETSYPDICNTTILLWIIRLYTKIFNNINDVTEQVCIQCIRNKKPFEEQLLRRLISDLCTCEIAKVPEDLVISFRNNTNIY